MTSTKLENRKPETETRKSEIENRQTPIGHSEREARKWLTTASFRRMKLENRKAKAENRKPGTSESSRRTKLQHRNSKIEKRLSGEPEAGKFGFPSEPTGRVLVRVLEAETLPGARLSSENRQVVVPPVASLFASYPQDATGLSLVTPLERPHLRKALTSV